MTSDPRSFTEKRCWQFFYFFSRFVTPKTGLNVNKDVHVDGGAFIINAMLGHQAKDLKKKKKWARVNFTPHFVNMFVHFMFVYIRTFLYCTYTCSYPFQMANL